MGKKFLAILCLLFVFAGSAFAWSNPRWAYFPLNVSIEDNDAYAPMAKGAFDAWRVAVPGILRFHYRTQKAIKTSMTQIRVSFVKQLPDGQPYNLGVNSSSQRYYYRNMNTSGYFYNIEITIATADDKGKPLPKHKLQSVMMHSVGKAMGVPCIMKEGSVMSCNTDFNKTKLTQDDVAALINVYKYVRNK